MSKIRVLVIGAGYAGVTAANRLRSSLSPDDAVQVVVLNRSSDFMERIRLHEIAAGTRASAARPLSDMLHPEVDLVVGDVVRIDAERRTVELLTPNGRRTEGYDALIYCVGSAAAADVPGARDFACLLANPDGADVARNAIAAMPPGGGITVVGGGPTGVEAAAEIAESHPDITVTLLCNGLLTSMPSAARTRIRRSLVRLGVQVREGASVVRVHEHAVELSDGTRLHSGTTVWAASFAVPQLARESDLAVDEIGRLRVDECLRTIDHPEIVGAGDAVRPPPSVGAHLRMSCAMAIPLGGHAADTVLARLRGTTPLPLSAGFIVQCLSLGRRRGYIQLVHADDTPRRAYLSGAPAAKFKEMICRLVVSGPRGEQNKPGTAKTVRGPRRNDPARAMT